MHEIWEALLEGAPFSFINLGVLAFGVGVIIEEYEGREELRALVPQLGVLTQHQDARVRSDACHYLSLTHDASARPYIEALLDDAHAEVREVAEESLAEL